MPAPLERNASVLVWMPRWLGDFQMAEPAVAALAAFLEMGALTLAVPRAYVELYDKEKFELASGVACVRLVVVEDREKLEGVLRASDAVLLLRGSFRSAWRAWRAGVPRRIGWARNGCGWLLTDCIVPAREAAGCTVSTNKVLPRPFSTAAAELVSMVGVPVRRTKSQLTPSAAQRALLGKRLLGHGFDVGTAFILLNVGGRSDSAKALDDWAPIVRPLLAAGRTVVAVAGPGEEQRLTTLLDSVRVSSEPARCKPVAKGGHALDYAQATCEGKQDGHESKSAARLIILENPVANLAELAALGVACDLAIGTDGGPRHLFAAARAYQLVLFGPTDPRHTASDLTATQPFIGHVECGPCHKEQCSEPASRHQACFAAINSNAVVEAALSYAPPEPCQPLPNEHA